MHSDARTTEVVSSDTLHTVRWRKLTWLRLQPAGNTLTIAGRRILGCWGQGLDELHRRPFPLRGPRLDPSAVSPPGERGTGRKVCGFAAGCSLMPEYLLSPSLTPACLEQEDWEGGTCLPDEVQCLLDWLHKTNQLSPQPLFIGSGDADEVTCQACAAAQLSCMLRCCCPDMSNAGRPACGLA
jgi:hypothetical protein